MVKLAKTFGQFKPFKALVIGDFLLDSYTTGRVKRISPEAPVPVMEVTSQESRPGGAGNVVLNLKAIGASVKAIGRIGGDPMGQVLQDLLNMSETKLFIEPNYQTPVKNRLIADSQQLLRIDLEKISSLNVDLENEIIKKLPQYVEDVDVIAISDYGKGFLTNRLLSSIIKLGKEKKIPTIVDPKGIDFTKYAGATMIKPNFSEAYAAAKCSSSVSLDVVANELSSFTDYLLITRSEAGISLFPQNGKRCDYPVFSSREVKDVTGAGDTVLSVLCLGFANKLELGVTIELANIAAGLAIERLGCVQITLSDMAKRLLEIDSDLKVFDENHTFVLKQVLKDKKYSLLVIEKGQSLTRTLFKTIRSLANLEGRELIIYVKDSSPDDEFVHLLSSINEVAYIILQKESLKNLCNEIHPAEIFELRRDEVVELSQAKILLDSLVVNRVNHTAT